MGKLTAKGRATRLRIVTAAAELMAEQGVAGTTMDHVRTRAAVSSSQVYHYFTAKEELVRAVVELENERVVGGQQDLLAGLDTLDGMRAWRDHLVDHQRRSQCRGGCPIGTLGSQLAEIDPLARADIAAGFHRWEDGIRSGLRRMHDRGALRPEADPDRLAAALLAAVQGGLLLTQVHRDPAPLADALDTVIEHIESLTA